MFRQPLQKCLQFLPDTIVPVGLFGLQIQISRVLSVTASAIPSRSCTPSFRGTSTGIPPSMTVWVLYLGKVTSAMIASSPLIQVSPSDHLHNLVRAIPKNQPLWIHSKKLGQLRPQLRCLCFRIQGKCGTSPLATLPTPGVSIQRDFH